MIRRVGLAATSALAASVVALVAAAPAFATPNDDPPVSGDPRATAYSQHVTGNPTKCADVASLKGDVDLEVGSKIVGKYLTITSVPEGFELTGVVVKGSDAYNVYLGDVRTDLHAPMTGKDNKNIADISHWFACGKKKTTTTPPTQPPTQPPGNTPPGNTPPGNTPPGNGETGGTGGAPQGSAGAELADTGVSTTVPLIAGGVLVLVGGGLLFLLRPNRRQRG